LPAALLLATARALAEAWAQLATWAFLIPPFCPPGAYLGDPRPAPSSRLGRAYARAHIRAWLLLAIEPAANLRDLERRRRQKVPPPRARTFL
jgi:hypothetical protein